MLVSGAGMSKGVKGLFEMMARCVANARVWNIRMAGDQVSSWLTGAQPGKTSTLSAAQCGLNVYCRHQMKTVLAQVGGKDEYHEALEL